MFYLFELRESDGNDCSVYDLIIEAPTLEAAREKAGDALTDLYPGHESDGCWGTFAPCECEHTDECRHNEADECQCYVANCEGHGGASVNGDDPTVTGFKTYEEAHEAGSIFHSAILIDADGSVR